MKARQAKKNLVREIRAQTGHWGDAKANARMERVRRAYARATDVREMKIAAFAAEVTAPGYTGVRFPSPRLAASRFF